MNMKKHQGDPASDSSESGDENQNVECAHINKAVDLQKVKKAIIRTGFYTDCEECKKIHTIETDDLEDLEYDFSLWLCLKCGNQGCGRSRNKHALKHYDTPHSDSHAMCINTTIWSVWCYDCDNEVNITCKKKLQEAVEYLRKQAESSKSKQPSVNSVDQVSLHFKFIIIFYCNSIAMQNCQFFLKRMGNF